MVNTSGYLLSIIIPTYNNAELITATLASIHQSITDDVEVIIVNDGSTDLTEERINAFYREKDCHNVKYISQKIKVLLSPVTLDLPMLRGNILALLTVTILSAQIISLFFSLS